jgi:hypothetical protein
MKAKDIQIFNGDNLITDSSLKLLILKTIQKLGSERTFTIYYDNRMFKFSISFISNGVIKLISQPVARLNISLCSFEDENEDEHDNYFSL